MLENLLPDYQSPPVIEVVFGIQFEHLQNLTTPHFGLLWEKYKPEFPLCKEVSPLQPSFEGFNDASNIALNLSDKPPLPRIWFLNESDTGIIQIQQDRFLHNWRKNNSEDKYPRYPNVKKSFEKNLNIFWSYLDENKIGEIKINQYELTYVNHIPQGQGWESLNDIGKIFKDFGWENQNKKMLKDISDINIRVSFNLPNQEGRLHIKVLNGFLKDKNLPLLRLDLTVRGMSQKNSNEAMWKWFDDAREWIVKGFADLTNEKIQNNLWKRKA